MGRRCARYRTDQRGTVKRVLPGHLDGRAAACHIGGRLWRDGGENRVHVAVGSAVQPAVAVTGAIVFALLSVYIIANLHATDE